MAQAARLNDTIWGMHGLSVITGNLYSCSPNVFINGRAAGCVGSVTIEYDDCGINFGAVGRGSSSVFINGQQAARNGDPINPHGGWANITSGSSDVDVGG